MPKKPKIAAATGVAVGQMPGLERARALEAAQTEAIKNTPRKDGESDNDYNDRLSAAMQKARESV